MKIRSLLCLTLLAVVAAAVHAEDVSWPQELVADSGAVVVIYQPQVEMYSGNDLEARTATRPATPVTQMARPANGIQNNVLTDRSGNVYQRDANGGWQTRENGQWTLPQNLDGARPSQLAVRPQLERDFNARQRGANRRQNYERRAAPRRR